MRPRSQCESGDGELVRCADIDAVELALHRHRRQMNHSRKKDDRQRRFAKSTDHRAETCDAMRLSTLVRSYKTQQLQLLVTGLARSNKGQSITGRASDQIERRAFLKPAHR